MGILDDFRMGALELSDLVQHYSKDADVRELLEFAKTQPDRISAMYVLAEIGEAADPVWKDVVQYAADPDYHTSYAVLRMAHQRARNIDAYPDVLRTIALIDLENDAFFAKAVALLCSVPRRSLILMLDAAMKDEHLGFHATGLLLLIYCTDMQEERLARILAASNKVVELYVCAVIVEYFEGHDIEKLLPPMVKEDITLLRRTRDRAKRDMGLR
jgi:hypothetical protein